MSVYSFACLGMIALSIARAGAAESDPAGAPASDSVWTLAGAYEQAVSQNPQGRASREKVQETRAGLSLAISAVFPTINGYAAATTKQDATNGQFAAFGGSSYNLYQTSVTATQPLFDGLKFWHGWDVAQRQVEIAKIDLEAIERDLTLQLLQSFYTILLNQRRLGHLEQSERVQREVLETARRRFKIGRAQRLDVLQIETQVALLLPQIAASRNQMQISAAQMLTLLGIRQTEGSREIQVRGRLDLSGWEKWMSTNARELASGEGLRPELRANRAQQAQLTGSRGVALSSHLPQLNGVVTVGNQATARADLFNAYGVYWSAGLQLTIPIFSGLSFWHTRSVYAAQAAQLEFQEQRILNDQAFERLQARKNLDLAASQITAANAAADLARQSLAEAQRNYKLATIDTIQFLQSQTNLLQAEISLDQTRYDALIALGRMGVAHGWSLEPLVHWMTDVSEDKPAEGKKG